MARALAVKVEEPDTRTVVPEAAKKMLRRSGHTKLSTRNVAAAASVPLCQIHYHFGSKQGICLLGLEKKDVPVRTRRAHACRSVLGATTTNHRRRLSCVNRILKN
jgi:AcrR family transcriptional regulator